MRKIFSFMADSLETVVITLSVWLVAYLFLGHGTKIYGSSMEPTFHDQQCVFTDTFSYKLHGPQRGDVVTVHAPALAGCVPGTGCDYFKRVIGLPGETVSVHDGAFYISGHKLTENYLPASTFTQSETFIDDRTITLGLNEFFVAGDNRQHSMDSRAFGPVTKSDIEGKAIWRYCPLTDFGPLQKVTY